MAEIKRKIYKRGSSFETTIPKPLLFAIDQDKEHNVIFRFNSEKNRWYIDFKASEEKPEQKEENIEKKSEGEKKEVEE